MSDPSSEGASGSESDSGADAFDGKLQQRTPSAVREAPRQQSAEVVERQAGLASSSGRKSSVIKDNVPVGVVVVEDGAPTVNLEMQRLLRLPRYFDENYKPTAAITCWRCGKRGHMSRDCTSGVSCKPCYLCAQYGHEAKDCPHRECTRMHIDGMAVPTCTNTRMRSCCLPCCTGPTCTVRAHA